jgi:hypothetical protein
MALDLTRDVPRSPFAELDGYAWLPRMIDKVRALYAGTLGDYSPYPCPGDRKFLGHFGLEHAPLGELIKGGASDEEVAAYVRQHAKGGEEAKAAFIKNQRSPNTGFLALALWVMRLLAAGKLRAKYPGIEIGSIDSIAKLLALEEGHPLP